MRAASLAAVTATLLLAGCGSSSGPPPHHRIHLTAFERHGKALFISACGGCHTLADAGTTGSFGPALDSPWQASRVRETIADGPGVMPANIYTGVKADEIAAYVAAATSGR